MGVLYLPQMVRPDLARMCICVILQKETEHPQLSSSLMGIASIRTSQANTNAASREDLAGGVFGN